MPEINRELFQKIYDQISQHPETHWQGWWETTENACGTTRCVAGWAVHFQNTEQDTYSTCCDLGYNGNHEIAGRELLGLTNEEAYELFYMTTDAQAAEQVELYALKGREWRNEPTP